MSYLPVECPYCGRVRLMPVVVRGEDHDFVRSVECEKCGTVWGDPPAKEEPPGGATLKPEVDSANRGSDA